MEEEIAEFNVQLSPFGVIFFADIPKPTDSSGNKVPSRIDGRML
jgi:hypothetical protein